MDARKKEDAMWFWMCSIPGMYRVNAANLLAYFGTPQQVYDAPMQEILSVRGASQKQKESLLRLRAGWDPEKEKHRLSEKGIRFINCRQKEYPARLLEIYDYPYGIFVKGELPSDEKPSAAVVGARVCSSYGRYWAERIGSTLAAAGVQVISGMARGIDGAAQKAALEAGGKSYGVLGCGVDRCYPGDHKQLYEQLSQHGGILSEYPPGTEPLSIHFPMRNRIISGLSQVVIVAEAKEKSGSLITADVALEQGRDILAVPGRAGDRLSAGCNGLIDQGAGIFISEKRLMERLGIRMPLERIRKKTNITLETREKLVYSVLEFQAKSLQSIASESGIAPGEAAALLVKLVLAGLAVEVSGGYYAKI